LEIIPPGRKFQEGFFYLSKSPTHFSQKEFFLLVLSEEFMFNLYLYNSSKII